MKQPPSAKSLEQIRTNARRRLLGAIVLVVVAVAILPWVLESKPREEEVQVPVEIINQPTAGMVVPQIPAPPVQISEPPLLPEIVPEQPPATTIEADPYIPPFISLGEGITTIDSGASTEGTGQWLGNNGYAIRPANKPEIASKVRSSETSAADAQRAAALLGENPATVVRPPTTASVSTTVSSDVSKKFLIQVGAYADPAKVSEVRARLTMAGYTSYTQDVQTNVGKTTRVRVGPVNGRQTAEEIAKKISALGLPVSILPS